MSTRNTTSSLSIEGRIETQVHDEADLREHADDYDSLSDEEKLSVAREVEPVETDVTHNVTVRGLHKYLVRNLDGGLSGDADNVNADWFAVGSDGTTPDKYRTDLNVREFSKEVTDHADNQDADPPELVASTFIESDEANFGSDIFEVGLFSGDPTVSDEAIFMLNHAALGSSVTKDSDRTVTFNVTLTFDDV